MSPFAHLLRLIRAVSLGCFAGILVMGAGYLATSVMIPHVAGFLAGDAIADGRAYQWWLRGVIACGVAVLAITTAIVWWRNAVSAEHGDDQGSAS